jgi:hypothetical protein
MFLTASVKLKPPKSQSLLCRPTCIVVPELRFWLRDRPRAGDDWELELAEERPESVRTRIGFSSLLEQAARALRMRDMNFGRDSSNDGRSTLEQVESEEVR